MMWQDFLINRQLTNEEVAAGFASVFSVSPDAVLVLRDPYMLADAALSLDGIEIISTCIDQHGDFVLLIEVILRTPELDQSVAERGDLQLIQALCMFWNVEALADDGSPSVTSWLHLRPGRVPEQAYLDPDELDNHDAIVLVRRPVTAD